MMSKTTPQPDMRPRPDFVTIQLSEAGRRMAGEAGTVGWANGRRHFHFVAGEPQEVERSFEWNHMLRHERFEGEPILEEILQQTEALSEPETKEGE
jgi:hypothetical protein